MGQSIQEWTKKNLWKTAFKKFEVIWSTSDHNFLYKVLNRPTKSGRKSIAITFLQICFFDSS